MSTETAIASSTVASERKPSWYHLTPERFIWAVLFVETFLWISERFRWFAFNDKKGWTVLIAVAVLGLSLLWFFLWFLSAWLYRRRFQFSIRMMLVLTVAVAVPFSWLAVRIEQAKRTRELTAVLNDKFNGLEYREWISAPLWMTNILGENFFTPIYKLCPSAIDFTDEDFKQCCELDELEICIMNHCAVTDASLDKIGNMTRLRYLDLSDTPITDASLKHLEKLHRLESLYLSNTNTTEAGVQEIQTKLPDCKISW